MFFKVVFLRKYNISNKPSVVLTIPVTVPMAPLTSPSLIWKVGACYKLVFSAFANNNATHVDIAPQHHSGTSAKAEVVQEAGCL
jgi:hypothetical protein